MVPLFPSGVLWVLWLAVGAAALNAQQPAGDISAADYPSIQAALDANPGRVVRLPAGDYKIQAKIRIAGEGSGLVGPGRIIQENPLAPIVEIEHARGAQLRGVILTRPEGAQETRCEGVLANDCQELVIEDVKVLFNRTLSASFRIQNSSAVSLRHCLVRDYMRISVDDRTHSPEYGYAFKCIDGSGIVVNECKSTLIQGCRVVEETMLPTPEVQKKHDLGRFVKKNPEKGRLMSQKVWDEERVNNWHQGSGIVVTSPEVTDMTQILGNQIENAAQGIDIHSDHVIIQGNIVNNAFIGMKAMHGSRHVLILGNQFIKNDLWSIGLMPGAAAHPAAPAADGKPEKRANADGGSIIANNIISDFGGGHAHWIWGEQGTPLRFDEGQQPDDPPLGDVVVQGNMVFDTGRDALIPAGPRYAYAVRLARNAKGMRFSGNLFDAGIKGVSNLPLEP